MIHDGRQRKRKKPPARSDAGLSSLNRLCDASPWWGSVFVLPWFLFCAYIMWIALVGYPRFAQ